MANQHEEQAPDLREYWRIIWEGRWYIIISFVVVVASTAFFTFTADPVYEASAKILVLTNRGKALGEESQALNLPSSLSGDIRNEVPNWIEMMKSRSAMEKAIINLESDDQFLALQKKKAETDKSSIFSKVAQALGLNSKENSSTENANKTFSLSVKELNGRLSVRRIPDTDLIEIKATGGNPLESKLITNALVQAYKELDVEITKTTVTNVKDFLKTQLEKTRGGLTAAEEEFAEFKRKTNLELGLDQIKNRLAQLEQMKAETELNLAEKKSDLEKINQRLGKVKDEFFEKDLTSQDSLAELPTTVDTTQVKKLRDEIKELEEQRLQYLKAGDYDSCQEVINNISQKIDEIKKLVGESAFTNSLSLYQELISNQLSLSMDRDKINDRLMSIQTRIDEQSNKLTEYGLKYERLQRDIEVNKGIYTLLSEEYEQARIADVGELGGIRVVSLASQPESPIKPKKKVNLILGAIVGLTIGTGFSFLKEYLDNTYKTPKQVERDLDIPSLGTIFQVEGDMPTNGDRAKQIENMLITEMNTKDPLVNSYVGIEASLRFASVDKPLKSILVTSSVPKEGKSSLVVNLGMVFALEGRSTLVIDSDLRRPIFYRMFGLEKEVGLTNAVLGETDLEEVTFKPYVDLTGRKVGRELTDLLIKEGQLTQKELNRALNIHRREGPEISLKDILIDEEIVKSEQINQALTKQSEGLENFHIMPPGTLPPNPTDFLGSEKMDNFIQLLKEKFDVILFDSPPVITAPDATVLSSKMDGAILVIEAQKTAKEPVQQAVESLEKAGANNLVGTVLNKLQKPSSRYYGGYYRGYYHYYGGYYQERED